MSISSNLGNQQIQEMMQEEQDFKKQLANNDKINEARSDLKKTLGKAATATKTGKKEASSEAPLAPQIAYIEAMANMANMNLKTMGQQADSMMNLQPDIQKDATALNNLTQAQDAITSGSSSGALEKQAELGAQMNVLNTDIANNGVKAQGAGISITTASEQNVAQATIAQQMIQMIIGREAM